MQAQLCPVCKGSGKYQPPKEAGKRQPKARKCHGCGGKGWVGVGIDYPQPHPIPQPMPCPRREPIPPWEPWAEPPWRVRRIWTTGGTTFEPCNPDITII